MCDAAIKPDDFVCAKRKLAADWYAQSMSGLEVDNEVKFSGRLNRRLADLLAL